tara:strand:- start:318 stop:533 length:216 start_codon:yes stop_codon:yes gene_type:complete
MYDKAKLSEYKFRVIVSTFLMCIIFYVVLFHETSGPGIFEIAFIGGMFAVLSLFHSLWAIKSILKEADEDL